MEHHRRRRTLWASRAHVVLSRTACSALLADVATDHPDGPERLAVESLRCGRISIDKLAPHEQFDLISVAHRVIGLAPRWSPEPPPAVTPRTVDELRDFAQRLHASLERADPDRAISRAFVDADDYYLTIAIAHKRAVARRAAIDPDTRPDEYADACAAVIAAEERLDTARRDACAAQDAAERVFPALTSMSEGPPGDE